MTLEQSIDFVVTNPWEKALFGGDVGNVWGHPWNWKHTASKETQKEGLRCC